MSTRQKRPIFLPEMANWVRPTWFATWVAMAFGASVLLPSISPIYGERFPNWVWLGIPILVLSQLGLAVYLDHHRRQGAYGWMVAGMASTGAAVIYTMGLSILIERSLTILDELALAGFGVFCLLLLIALDRIGFLAEQWAPPESRGFVVWGGRLVPESYVLFGFVLGGFFVLVATYLLVA